MASWKASVASLTAFFERASRQEDPRDTCGDNEKDVIESSTVEAGRGNEGRSSDTNNATEFKSMVHDVWSDLLCHARESHHSGMDKVFAAAGDSLMNKTPTNVAEEVYRQELIAILEAVSSYVAMSKTEGFGLSGEKAIVTSLKRRLCDMSKVAENAKVALQFANKEKTELEDICEEYEERRRNLLWLWKEAEEGNEELRSVNGALENSVKQMAAHIKRLEAEKDLCDVERLRALHRAEMAELVAKQAALHAKRVDQQLKNALNSSHLVHKQVQNLKRALEEVTTIVTTAVPSSEAPRPQWLEGQVGSLVHGSSKRFDRFQTSGSRDASNVNGSGRNEAERNGGEMEGVEHENREEPSSPRVGKMKSLRLLFNLKQRQRRATQAGVLHRITSRLRRHGMEQGNETEAREAQEEMGTRGECGSLAVADSNGESPLSAYFGSAGVRRVLTRGIRGELEGQLQATSPQTMESIPKALEKLEKTLKTLTDIYKTRDDEVYRLNQELQDAIRRSDALEQNMKRECHKRLEVENGLVVRSKRSARKKTNVLEKCADKIGERTHNMNEKVTVRRSCRWF